MIISDAVERSTCIDRYYNIIIIVCVCKSIDIPIGYVLLNIYIYTLFTFN